MCKNNKNNCETKPTQKDRILSGYRENAVPIVSVYLSVYRTLLIQ